MATATINPAASITCEGVSGTVTIRRDAYGVAHVQAANAPDAYFGQGFAAASDRLWQMEYDRRRAVGRWSEAAGRSALPADILARRLDLGAAARADLEVMANPVRVLFDAYAAGVNAFLGSGISLPPEYALTGISPEPWEAWQSIAVFKIRHILMGTWQWKMAVGGLLARVGIDTFRTLGLLPPLGTSVILPPGGSIATLYNHANAEIEVAAEHLGFLSEIEAGSNSWVAHGSRTTTGRPVICNDSHRALDVPNAYWQVHLRCPQFNVSGGTFAGFPGFPHFGFNGAVAWNITHTQGDYQDLFVERFEGANGERYLAADGWHDAERRSETINVRDAEPVTMDCWRTAHGPIIHGDPRQGTGIALRYTANAGPKPAFDGIDAMLRANTVAELFDAQATWVDPVNNLVAADSSGNIGFLLRGELPIRASKAGRELPVAGWTGEHEWTGSVPFAQMPRSINPPEGYFATANQRVVDGDEPYIGSYFASPARADRLRELFATAEKHDPATIASWQGDTTSRPARAWAAFLRAAGPFTGDSEHARALLAAWDGNLIGTTAPPLLYAYFRRALMRELFAPIVGEETWAWLASDANPGIGRIAGAMLAEIVSKLEDGVLPPGGRTWSEVLEPALAAAWVNAAALGGPEPSAWRWDSRHQTASRHTLSAIFPGEALDPPSVRVGGDADTLQCAGYGLSGKRDFVITNLSVYRQVVDFTEPSAASYIVPGGVSGDRRSAHFADQLEHWRRHERIAMLREPAQAESRAVIAMTTNPA